MEFAFSRYAGYVFKEKCWFNGARRAEADDCNV